MSSITVSVTAGVVGSVVAAAGVASVAAGVVGVGSDAAAGAATVADVVPFAFSPVDSLAFCVVFFDRICTKIK